MMKKIKKEKKQGINVLVNRNKPTRATILSRIDKVGEHLPSSLACVSICEDSDAGDLLSDNGERSSFFKTDAC